ncbi:hypothetical protein GOP47_0016678 [Adiantum capillus-veneris]|uniref:Rhamnogalacturonase A/B/Epimerase-like pectate lyase domain-containing protein n=1 Tax=Adiantum capillus-veneris TaxID=13818 RepID=A0A9D4ZAJ0_ADICA|nr:hypothetical protein GOP47_0016678 [Adiantum capillus-veneris]
MCCCSGGPSPFDQLLHMTTVGVMLPPLNQCRRCCSMNILFLTMLLAASCKLASHSSSMAMYSWHVCVLVSSCLLYLHCKHTVLVDAWQNSLKTASSLPSMSPDEDFCASLRILPSRAQVMSLTDFGAVGDGVTTNTHAFQDAIHFLSAYSNEGGGQLHVPAGKWLTGSFNLTSHFTLFLDKDAVILGSQDPREWPVIDSLPSYGRGRELPGGRHISLIHGENLTDVVITGSNGTVDGQGEMWWNMHAKGKLDYTRGHLVELMHCQDVIISNLTLKNSPFWTVHPVYSSNVLIQYLTILAPIESFNTDGIDPDSSSRVCIEDCYIQNGDDLISIKSGWDEYGIAYGHPSTKISIQRIVGETRSSAGIALGSEMSGGISAVYVNDVTVHHAATGVRVKSAQGRGGYVNDVYVSNVMLHNVKTGIGFTALYGEHPDGKYNHTAIPQVERVYIQNVTGINITLAGDFEGLADFPFKDIYLVNIALDVTSPHSKWRCVNVGGYSSSVHPEPCSQFSAMVLS